MNIEGGDGKMTAAKQAMQAYRASNEYVTPIKARTDHEPRLVVHCNDAMRL